VNQKVTGSLPCPCQGAQPAPEPAATYTPSTLIPESHDTEPAIRNGPAGFLGRGGGAGFLGFGGAAGFLGFGGAAGFLGFGGAGFSGRAGGTGGRGRDGG
jgi:hypothetical protein